MSRVDARASGGFANSPIARLLLLVATASLAVMAGPANGADQPAAPVPPPAAAPAPPVPPPAAVEPRAKFSNAQLEQLVAPIALYPDGLTVQILMAATYPLEIVEASRWRGKNKDLQGDAIDKALEGQDWDPHPGVGAELVRGVAVQEQRGSVVGHDVTVMDEGEGDVDAVP